MKNMHDARLAELYRAGFEAIDHFSHCNTVEEAMLFIGEADTFTGDMNSNITRSRSESL
jgi:hypothetical protein